MSCLLEQQVIKDYYGQTFFAKAERTKFTWKKWYMLLTYVSMFIRDLCGDNVPELAFFSSQSF